MTSKVIELRNTIHWDRQKGDKVYLDKVRLTLKQFPFALRQPRVRPLCQLIFLRFADGPGMDSCTFDMDRLVLEYLKLRGVKPPIKLCNLTKAKKPIRCDFIVPRRLLPSPDSCRRKGKLNGKHPRR